MTTADVGSVRDRATAEPAYRVFQRVALAGCVLLAPVLMALGFAFDPTGSVGVPSNLNTLVAEFRAAGPVKVQLFLYFNAVAVYFFALSYLGLGLLAMRRSPWLATLGIGFGLIGSLPWGLFVGPEALAASVARVGATASNAAVVHMVFSEGAIFLLEATWVAGHLIGYVLLGLALARSRAIPQWAGWLIVAAAILMGPIAYGAHIGWLQIGGFALVFVASIPAARVLLRASGGASVRTQTEALASPN